MKKRYRFLILFIFLIGLFFLMEWIFPNYLTNWLKGFIQIPFYGHVILFFGTFFGVVLLHELAHALAFVIRSVSLKVIMVLCFIFYKSDRWHVAIDFKLLALGGGIVMPHFSEIKVQSDLVQYQNSTAYSLIFAPTFTIVFSLVLFIINIVFFHQTAWLTVMNLYVLLFSLIFTYTSTLQASGMYGDFVAYKKVKTDPVFGLSVISQFVDEVSDYHIGLLQEALKGRPLYDFNLDVLNFYGLLLEKGIYDDEAPDVFLLEKTKVLARQHHTIRRILRNHQLYVLIELVIGYLYRCNEDDLVEQVLVLFEFELNDSKLKTSTKDHYSKQIRHLIGLSDESDFLNTEHDFSTGLIDDILSHLPEYSLEEKNRNKPIVRFEKKETIHLDNKEPL
ncbi:hypothetical protein N7603_02405 [Acholeplasma vituli]|uniref:Peptidase M50 domain-containing protein n=1 Tax=Paracholeplasma vituli TaxID=69473 RepID=A0ABT2PUA0_9MOLU|nr:hypothetical protein [Paracholeplasma vituli]MCU0104502.1 hypothetical protein [Paracholeplasma vituli]